MKITQIKQLKIPTLDKLAGVCNLADSTMKAWICCQKDSGLSTLDLLNIDLKTINNQLGNIPIHIETHHQMIGAMTNTFFGPNAIDALQKYLLKQNTERLFNIRQKIICNKLKKLDLSPYALRKFFYHNMIKAQVPKLLVFHWMGHIEPTQPVNMPIEEMKRIYLRAYPCIDVNKNR